MNPLEIRAAPLSPSAETQALAQAPEQVPALGRSREDLARTTLAVFFMTGLAAVKTSNCSIAASPSFSA